MQVPEQKQEQKQTQEQQQRLLSTCNCDRASSCDCDRDRDHDRDCPTEGVPDKEIFLLVRLTLSYKRQSSTGPDGLDRHRRSCFGSVEP